MYKLPTNGHTGSKECQMEKFDIRSLQKISASLSADDYTLFIEALDDKLDVDVFSLGFRDFYKLILIQRLICFPNSPIEFSWTCSGVVLSTDDGTIVTKEETRDLDPKTELLAKTCGVYNVKTLSSIEDFKEIMFDYELPDYAAIPTVALLAEYRRMIDEPQLRFIVPIAAWLKEGETLADKIELIGSDLDLFDKLSDLNSLDHGIVSKVEARCSSCDKAVVKRIDVDNTSFFRL